MTDTRVQHKKDLSIKSIQKVELHHQEASLEGIFIPSPLILQA